MAGLRRRLKILSVPVQAVLPAVAVVLCAWGASRTAHAAEPWEPPRVQATPTDVAPVIDGKLDDAVWGTAEEFAAFRQIFPAFGHETAVTTTLRLLVDGKSLYVAFTCSDPTYDTVTRKTGNRDESLWKGSGSTGDDAVGVLLDTDLDGNDAFGFFVSSTGVQQDLLLIGNTSSSEWDAPWTGNATRTPDGWTAEMAIPLNRIRARRGPQAWGFHAVRTTASTQSEDGLAPVARSVFNPVARFGRVDLDVPEIAGAVDLQAYVGGGAVVTPQYETARLAHPRLIAPQLDFGGSVRAVVRPNLILSGTANPDFAAVEPDRLIFNRTRFEPYFPELRPFFQSALDQFKVQSANPDTPQVLYSRRIGLDIPLFAAATVEAWSGPWRVVALDALAMDAVDPSKPRAPNGIFDERYPDRRVQFHWERPLHLGPNYELASGRPPGTNFFASSASYRYEQTAEFRAMVAAATPVSDVCEPRDFTVFPTQGIPDCTAFGNQALALEGNYRTEDGEWEVAASLLGSRATGGSVALRLSDGTALADGDLGWGFTTAAGKQGGEPLRYWLELSYLGPKLDVNSTGYQRIQNHQAVTGNVQLYRAGTIGPFHEASATLRVENAFSADDRLYHTGTRSELAVSALTRSESTLTALVGYDAARLDLREIYGTGIPLEARQSVISAASYDTNPAKALSGGLGFELDLFRPRGPFSTDVSWAVAGRAGWRINKKADLAIDGGADKRNVGARWVGFDPDVVIYESGDHDDVDPNLTPTVYFAELPAPLAIRVGLRARLFITNRLSLSLIARGQRVWGAHGPFYEGQGSRLDPVRLSELVPHRTIEGGDFSVISAIGQIVARWEFRPGVVAYLVYNRAQFNDVPRDEPARPLGLGDLADGRAVDQFLFRFSYLWQL